MSQHVGQQPSDPDDIQERTALIEVTYREVLDATKHQDDKIGRLLTAIAFLTAAALALAGLHGADLVTRVFDVRPYRLPLALIALAVFLIGVVFAVVLLVAGFATPLRLPGLAQLPPGEEVRWVTQAKGSQLYFSEIAGLSLAEWREKWLCDEAALRRERFDSYVAETHNLGVRTHFKYDRTAEAIAIFSLSMMSLGLAIVLVVWAAAAPPTGAVAMGAGPRGAMAAVLGLYCLVQVVARLRYRRQTIDEVVGWWERTPKGRRAMAERVYAVFLSSAVALTVAFGPGSRLAVWLVAAATVVAGYAYWCALAGDRKRRRRTAQTSGVMVALLLAAVASLLRGNYAVQLLTGYVAAVVLLLPSLFGPSNATARRRRTFVDRRAVSEAA